MDSDFRAYTRGRAAQAWCAETCRHLAMEPDLANRFAEILAQEISRAFVEGYEAGAGDGPSSTLRRKDGAHLAYLSKLGREMEAQPDDEEDRR